MKLIHIVLLCAGSTFLSACNFAPVGKSNFDCNRQEDANSPYCRSFKAVLVGANPPLAPTRFDLRANQQEYERMAGIAPISEQSGMPLQGTTKDAIVLPHLSSGPSLVSSSTRHMPVRQAPTLQRAWIKRHVEGDTLVDDTEITWETSPSRWVGLPSVTTTQGSQTTGQIIPFRADKSIVAPGLASQVINDSNGYTPPQTQEFRQPGVVDSAAPPAVKGSLPLPQ